MSVDALSASPKPVNDQVRTLFMWRLWILMAWQDIRQRYRGSVIGPFWLTGSIAATSLGLGFLYAAILKQDPREFIPYVTVGLVIWTFISQTMVEGCATFLAATGLLKNTAMPVTLQVYRTVARNLIIFGHNVLVIIVVFAAFRVVPGPELVLVIPGMILVTLNMLWITYIFAVISARYRDILQVITYVIQFLIFATPVFWQSEQVGRDFPLLRFNPFYHLLEIVRGPILGYEPSLENWIVAGGLAVAGLAFAAFVNVRFGRSIVFWV